LINHEITYDSVMKRHHRPRCPPFERAGGAVPQSFQGSPASLLTPASGETNFSIDHDLLKTQQFFLFKTYNILIFFPCYIASNISLNFIRWLELLWGKMCYLSIQTNTARIHTSTKRLQCRRCK